MDVLSISSDSTKSSPEKVVGIRSLKFLQIYSKRLKKIVRILRKSLVLFNEDYITFREEMVDNQRISLIDFIGTGFLVMYRATKLESAARKIIKKIDHYQGTDDVLVSELIRSSHEEYNVIVELEKNIQESVNKSFEFIESTFSLTY